MEELRVRRIKEGTVIDHIPPGKALKVLSILGISGSEGTVVAVLMNVESRKLGRKDIVKLEGRFLTRDEVDEISLVAPTATINIIRDFEVAEKFKLSLPEVLEGIVRCPNPRCVSNLEGEPVTPRLELLDPRRSIYRCHYCGRLVEVSEMEELLLQ